MERQRGFFGSIVLAFAGVAACGTTATTSDGDAASPESTACPPKSTGACYYAPAADAGAAPDASASGLYPQDYCNAVCPTASGWSCGRVKCGDVICTKRNDTDAGVGADTNCEAAFRE